MIRRNMSMSERARHQEESGAGGRGVSPQFSSASGLSSPPRSSPEPGTPSVSAHLANESTSNPNSSITVNPPGGVVVDNNSAEKPARRKPGRKPGSVNKPKNNADSSATNTDAPKVRKTRKPRDPNAPPLQRRRKNGGGGSDASSVVDVKAAAGVQMGPQGQAGPEQLTSFHVPAAAAATQPQKGKSEDIQRPIQSFFTNPPPPPQQQSQPQQPVRTSGQNYDPIRSNYDPVRETVVTHNSYNNSQGSPSHPHSVNRASASPSISSLVDPPNQALASPSIAAQSFFNQQQQQARFQRDEGHASVPPSPTVNRLAPSAIVEPSTQKPSAPVTMAVKKHDVAPASGPSTISKKGMGPGSTANSSAAASPKPHKVKEPKEPKELYPTPPPLPGSGLMQLGGAGVSDGAEFRAPTVILQIPLNGEVNKYVNFTRLAEERYGWDALHPRLAAQRDRLARVAAAGAALERNGSNKDSGDEMSLDSEAEGSNVEMGGMSDGRTGTDGGAKKVPRKRKMKEDEYDKDDGFVDDSELLWEEQAAAANDGFFVYSGPLVPESEKPALDHRYVLSHVIYGI